VAGFDVRTSLSKWNLYGLAIAPNGTIYASAQLQSGNSVENAINATALFRISGSGHASVLPITTPLRSTLPSPGAPYFPSSTYPVPVPSSDARLSTCPNPKGIEPFNAKAKAAISTMFATFGPRKGLFDDLGATDRSWWQGLFEALQNYNLPLPSNVFEFVVPASSDPLAKMIASACGAQLVKESLVIHTSPGPPYGVDNFFVLDRGGHPLVYFQGS
jgi:hypothetical protein